MAILIWLVLSFFDVCSFSWIPILIDSIIALIIHSMTHEENGTNLIFYLLMGVVYFSVYKVFFHLSLPLWTILLAPIIAFGTFYVPGGFTILNFVLKYFGFATISIVGFIIGIVIDVLIFTGMRKMR